MTVLLSLPPGSDEPDVLHTPEGLPFDQALRAVPGGNALVFLVPAPGPHNPPPKLPGWLEVLSAGLGSYRLMAACAAPDGPLAPADLLLFRGRRFVRALRNAHLEPIGCVLEFVFDLDNTDVKTLAHFDRPRPVDADGRPGG